MFCPVVKAWSIDFARVEGADETPPLGIAELFDTVGLGVTTFVGAGLGVLVGAGVAVGMGVSVGGKGVAVGLGVCVGVAVGGKGVAVGGKGIAASETGVDIVDRDVEVGGMGVSVGSGVVPWPHAVSSTATMTIQISGLKMRHMVVSSVGTLSENH